MIKFTVCEDKNPRNDTLLLQVTHTHTTFPKGCHSTAALILKHKCKLKNWEKEPFFFFHPGPFQF